MIETNEPAITTARSAVRAGPGREVAAKQERSRETREALLDAFMALLHEGPYSAIGPADIARRAGVTTGAVYGRFGGKRGVVMALHERFTERSAATMESWGAQARWDTATPAAIIENWTRGAVNFCRMYRPFLALMIDDPEVREQYDALMARPPRILARLLRRAVPGEPGPRFDADVEWAARVALVVLERFDLDDPELNGRLQTMLERMIGVE